MSVYDIATEQWDPILVFFCTQRLPKLTVILWEQSLTDKSSLSSCSQLDFFLAERIQTLACLWDIKDIDSSKSTSRNVKTHLVKSTDTIKPYANNRCPLCPNGNDAIYSCLRFKRLTFDQKLAAVNKKNLCFNCLLRSHSVSNVTVMYVVEGIIHFYAN